MHTKETSGCAYVNDEDMVRAYKERGYSGIIVTDHFVNGNSHACCREGEWSERIHNYSKGYLAAKSAGEKYGLDVFYGFEYFRDGDDFLVFGISEEFLLQNPGMDLWDMEFLAERVHEQGGLIFHAHPFRTAPYLHDKPINVRKQPIVDGIEVFNGSSHTNFNEKALNFAVSNGLLMSAGSDAHRIQGINSGIYLEERPNSVSELVGMIKNNRYTIKQGKRMFLYDTHVHSSDMSRCAHNTAAEMCHEAKLKGYTGFVLTEHFFTNSSYNIDRTLPWDEMMKQFYASYEAAHEEGRKIDFDVLFGLEMTFPSYDILTYGLSLDFLLAHPELQNFVADKIALKSKAENKTYDEAIGEAVDEYSRLIHNAGGYLVAAHPCRCRQGIIDDYILRNVDAIEVFNGTTRHPHYPKIVNAYAEQYEKVKLAGSDAHSCDSISSGVYLPERTDDISRFIELIKEGPELKKGDVFHVEIP